MKCHACGQDNAERALFCSSCRRPLVAPAALPTRLEALTPAAAPAGAAAAAAEPGPFGSTNGGLRDRFAPPNAATGAAGQATAGEGEITDEEAWTAIIGPNNTDYYLERFARLSHMDSAAWHWPGFFVTWYWMLYRKMWLPALAYFFLPYLMMIPFAVLGAVAPAAMGLLAIVWWLAWIFGPPIFANRLYFNHCRKLIANIKRQSNSREQALARMEARGGTSGILVIILALFGLVAIVGILAAVSIPAYQQYTHKAKVAEAVMTGQQLADEVGASYERTGQLPSDVNRMLDEMPTHARIVRGAELDGTTGALTLHVELDPRTRGSIEFQPQADSARHLTWTCSSPDLSMRLMPRSCPGIATSR